MDRAVPRVESFGGQGGSINSTGVAVPMATKRPGVMSLLQQQAEIVDLLQKLTVDIEDRTASVCVSEPEREDNMKMETPAEDTQSIRPDNIIRAINIRLNRVADRLSKVSRTINI